MRKRSNTKIRPGTIEDLPFLEKMLYEAFFWDPSAARPGLEAFLQHPEFRRLLADWGKHGDTAVIAEDGDAPIGAAWYRFGSEENHSYGFVNPDTPEIGMGIVPAHRSKGLGRALLRALIKAAQAQGTRSLSLSVEPANFAGQLYESEGFVKVGESGTSRTLMLDLRPWGRLQPDLPRLYLNL